MGDSANRVEKVVEQTVKMVSAIARISRDAGYRDKLAAMADLPRYDENEFCKVFRSALWEVLAMHRPEVRKLPNRPRPLEMERDIVERLRNDFSPTQRNRRKVDCSRVSNSTLTIVTRIEESFATFSGLLSSTVPSPASSAAASQTEE